MKSAFRQIRKDTSSISPKPSVAHIEWIDPIMTGGHWMMPLIDWAGDQLYTFIPGNLATIIEQMSIHKPKSILNWSGGKDSSIALHKILQENKYEVSFLFTTINASFDRISQHGVRSQLLKEQARSIDIPLKTVSLPDTPTMESYNRIMKQALSGFKKEGLTHSIFGDIFLEDLRQYREDRLAEAGFDGVFPLWKQDTTRLAQKFIRDGFKAVVVCVDDTHLDNSFSGRIYDETFLNDLPDGVDPCGENGEFHTFVYDGPIFSEPVPWNLGEKVYRTYTPQSRNNNEKDAEKHGDHQVETEEDDFQCGENRDDRSGQRENRPNPGFWFCDLLPAG
jgi:uncharacterized protein (TIGR00290 family)